MNIRKPDMSDLDSILHIYAYARQQMKKNGNPTQWGNDKPDPETIIQDIKGETAGSLHFYLEKIPPIK